jgi:hypothetical protein
VTPRSPNLGDDSSYRATAAQLRKPGVRPARLTSDPASDRSSQDNALAPPPKEVAGQFGEDS